MGLFKKLEARMKKREYTLIDRTNDYQVKLGSLVRYKAPLAYKASFANEIGIVVSAFYGSGGWRAVVQWNSIRREEWISGLELICK